MISKVGAKANFLEDHTGRVKGNLLNVGIDGHLGIGQYHRLIDSPPHSLPNQIVVRWIKREQEER